MSHRRMSRKEFRHWIKVQACSLAFLYYKNNHPGVSDEQSEAFAVEHWRQWVDAALEVMAYRGGQGGDGFNPYRRTGQ